MSKKPLKPLPFITEITEQWIRANYPKADDHDVRGFQQRLNSFLEYLGMTDAEFIQSFKRSPDRVEWARQYGQKLVQFYNKLINEGKTVNTARSVTGTVRAFSRDNAMPLMIPRKKIAKAKWRRVSMSLPREN